MSKSEEARVIPSLPPAVTLQQLRAFREIARAGRLAWAAEALQLSEPTVSSHLSALEKLLGTVLLERSRGRKTLKLTEPGKLLLDTCGPVLDQLDAGLEAVHSAYGPDRATLVIGSSPTFASGVLTRLVDFFNADDPACSVRIEMARSKDLFEGVRSRRLDIAICIDPPPDPRLQVEPYCTAEIGLYGRPDHPLAIEKSISWTTLMSEKFVLPALSASPRSMVDRLFAERDISVSVVMESDDMYSRMLAISGGLGIGPLYVDSAAPLVDSQQLSVLRAQGFPLHHRRSVVYRADDLSRAAERFRALLMHFESAIENGEFMTMSAPAPGALRLA